MGLPRSTFYDTPVVNTSDEAIVSCMVAICEAFETSGYRRVGAALRLRKHVVNGKKVRRLMREHDLQPRRRRRYVATTDSNHDNPIFSDHARDIVLTGPNSSGSPTSRTLRSRPALSLSRPFRCLVTPCRRLCDQPAHRCTSCYGGLESRLPLVPNRLRAACIIPTVGRSTHPAPTDSSSSIMASSG